MVRPFIAFGGNLGDVRDTFVQARTELAGIDGVALKTSSMLYRTSPLGPAGQPDYLNAVVEIETSLELPALLDALQRIENLHGRVRHERWGARTLDLDIVACGELILESERLTLPHPHMHERLFVLRPLCDIAPAWHHPHMKMSAGQLLQRLLDAGETPLPEGEPW